jgi:hypothetical protein
MAAQFAPAAAASRRHLRLTTHLRCHRLLNSFRPLQRLCRRRFDSFCRRRRRRRLRNALYTLGELHLLRSHTTTVLEGPHSYNALR